MIPKIIHYCWFGRGLMPESQKDCIRSWKKYCPEYQIIRWDESNFDVNCMSYVSEAYKQKKWAFVSDVARLNALLTMGGVYLDTDVELFAPLDEFLSYNAFSGVEIFNESFEKTSRHLVDDDGKPIGNCSDIQYCGILAAVIGAEAGNTLLQECYDYYVNNLSYDMKGEFKGVVIDGLLPQLAVKYGYRYKDCLQRLDVMTLFPSYVFPYSGRELLPESVAFHHTALSWQPKGFKRKVLILMDKLGILKRYRAIKKFFLSGDLL